MASALNFFKMEFVNMQTTISCFFAIALQIVMIYFPILIMNILQKNYDKLDKSKFLDQFSTIIVELDITHPSKYMYYAIFLMRRIIFVFIMILMADKTIYCLAAQCATSVFLILYVLIAKPFKRRITAVLTILGEIALMCFHFVSLAILNPDQPDDENQ